MSETKKSNYMNLVNRERLIETMRELIETPSVVGYTRAIHPVLERMSAPLGLEMEADLRRTAYLRIPGKNPDCTICLGGHLDTIGLVVRSIDKDGLLNVRNLGGVNFHSLEGENVIIHTRRDSDYTGSIICKSHSVHVFDDARERVRDFAEMAVLPDLPVADGDDLRGFGIQPGDLISVDPRFTVTSTGFVKSRHLDDKACVAALLEAAYIMKENGLRPACDILLAFPINEEIGQGGRFVPEDVAAYIALDIGLIGGEQSGTEHTVSIGAADRISPYDWKLTGVLQDLAEDNGIPNVMDIYYRYASDATAAMNGGCNLVPATFGPAVMNSHGYERTHLESIVATTALALACMLELTPEQII